MTSTTIESTSYSISRANIFRWAAIIVLVYLLLVAVAVIGNGFQLASAGHAVRLFDFASNPVIAVIIGVVATAFIQSSSTVTSIIVGLVAGGMPLGIAIPMIMGANVGTSLTSTLVSLGHVRDREQFKRAFSAATVHDSFNLLAVLLLLPIEVFFSPLEKISGFFASFLRAGSVTDVGGLNIIGMAVKPASNGIESVFTIIPGILAGVLMVITGIVLILLVIKYMGEILKKVMSGRALDILHRTIGRNPISGIGAGGFITVLVQSSSTTTSLIVPMAGNGLFSLKQVYPFVLGANLGTTVTALLAAVAISGPLAAMAMQIALVHFFFNLFAIFLIYTLPFLRNIPVFMAERLSMLALRNKAYVLAYIIIVFFIGPLSVIGVSRLFGL